MIECTSSSWTRSSLAHDQPIKWPKGKSTSLFRFRLMHGRMSDPAEANRRWEGQVEESQRTDWFFQILTWKWWTTDWVRVEYFHRTNVAGNPPEKSRKTCKYVHVQWYWLDVKRKFRTMCFKFRTSQEMRWEILRVGKQKSGAALQSFKSLLGLSPTQKGRAWISWRVIESVLTNCLGMLVLGTHR